jgi:hypothetical protein
MKDVTSRIEEKKRKAVKAGTVSINVNTLFL